MKKFTLALIFSLCLILNMEFAFGQSQVTSDDTLKKVSVDELLQLRRQLLDRQNKLRNMEQKLRGKGVGLSKEFINATRAENENQDKILIRVAEYYIENAEENFDGAMESYYQKLDEFDANYEKWQAGKIKTEPKEPPMPKLDYSKAITIYDVIVENFPEAELADDALYSKAFLYNKMEKGFETRRSYQEIIDKYPDSQYVVEAYMQLGEYYFMPREDKNTEENIIEMQNAIRLYRKVLKYKDSKRYDEALYKLGWTYYRLAGEDPDHFNDAIVYFTALVKDVEKAKKLDPDEKISNVDLEPEALEYIGICFSDETYEKSGIQNCKSYVEKLGRPGFGVEIIRNLGSTYAKVDNNTEAINSYNELLSMYPDYKNAPEIQKNVADIYYKIDDPVNAYTANEVLFNNYNPNSEWYKNYQQEEEDETRFEILDNAYKYTEEALRTNVVYDVNMAQDRELQGENVTESYTKIVDQAYQYLEVYPTDKNAYGINWSLALVLDTKLGKYEEAYEEYISVSNDYLEDDYREAAANNAIVVADSLVFFAKQETLVEDTVKVEGMEKAAPVATDLTETEKRLAEAYDNYLKLFPKGEKTPDILVAAGGLFYEHRQYESAKTYYKTLVTRFPNAKEKNLAFFSMMNTYFQLGQYVDAELVARKIVEMENIPEEKREMALKRISESIYKNAEKLEQEENYVEAGYEYLRVFRDAIGDVKFVDLALLKAGVAFDKAEQYNKAIEAYFLLADNCPKSKYAIHALEAVAQDYKILEDYVKVAETFEDIYKRFPEKKEAEIALYNSSYYYAEAKDWQSAIRINELYVERYPDSPDSKDLYFENAKYYLKLDNLESANEIYRQFALKFPNDPRVVEAYFQRGKYYFDNDQFEPAKTEFTAAINKSEELRRTGNDPNAPIAAEAMYSLAEILYKEYESVEFRYPESQIRQSINIKKALLTQLETLYKKIIGYGSIRSFEAMFKIAYLYESLANSISMPIFPENMSLENRIAEKSKMLVSSVNIFEKALEEYINVNRTIPMLAERMGFSLTEDAVIEEIEPAFEDSIQVMDKETLIDSTKIVAKKWLRNSEEKISQVLYVMAERNAAITSDIVNAPNPYPPLSWEYVLYQEQLIRSIVPKIGITIRAHIRNINESEKRNISNKYVLESERKLLQAANMVGNIYENALNGTFRQYKILIEKFDKLVKEGDQATDESGYTYYDYYDNILNIIDYFNTFAGSSLNGYENTLKFANENNIVNDVSKTTEEKCMYLASTASDEIKIFVDYAKIKSEYYQALYDSNTTNLNYQDGQIFFSDFAASLADYNRNILENAFAIHETYNIENYWHNIVLAKLIEIDPNTYLANIPKEKLIITTDEEWKVSNIYDPGFAYKDFDETSWVNGKIVELPPELSFPMFDSIGVNPPSIWIYSLTEEPALMDMDTIVQDTTLITDSLGAVVATQDSLAADTLAAVVSDVINYADIDTGEVSTIYFRKTLELPSKPINGYLMVTADNDFRLYINEEYILDDFDDDFEKIEKMNLLHFQEFLMTGVTNLIAIDVADNTGKPRNGLRFYLYLELMPKEITKTLANMRNAKEYELDKVELKKISILNKNRIVQ
ncbi:MAG: tetratricopeptide repeat protein [Calditrichia bacterium]|nr:tetratricopeptide repeat protein [Calditrichia bacterium]